MAQVFHRAERSAILRVTNVDPSIDVLDFDACTAGAQLPAQVVTDVAVMIHMQTEVVVDSAGNRAGLDFGLGIRWDGQLNRTVDRTEFNGRAGKLIKPRVQVAIDSGELGAPEKIMCLQPAIDA